LVFGRALEALRVAWLIGAARLLAIALLARLGLVEAALLLALLVVLALLLLAPLLVLLQRGIPVGILGLVGHHSLLLMRATLGARGLDERQRRLSLAVSPGARN
jgi:hypothetical protein